ncbi:MAG: hypothetical protein JRJ87_25790, partial [Deltaproteobacteria bacterium]|nr:hypothetical protein [Deltaproteobacteria bacterium]
MAGDDGGLTGDDGGLAGDDGGIGPVEDYPPFCARVSTQTINPRYAFTGDTRLVE